MKKSLFSIFFCLSSVLILSSTVVKAQVEEVETSRGLYYYSGFIGDNDKIEFNLQFSGLVVSGSYIIERTGDMFVFNGRMGLDRKGIGVLVYNANNVFVASIEAAFINEENNFGKMLKGQWKSADGKSLKNIRLKKVAEFASGATQIDPIYELHKAD